MRLEKLLLDLRPRPHAQALDLGFALLRANAGACYGAWLSLWLPLSALCALCLYLTPRYGMVSMVVLWWLKPLLERAPLYVLSRSVFGEQVSWQQALRAWPRQLGGGWLLMLTWWRLLAAGRGLYQPIWQLEGARGKVAAERRRLIDLEGTGRAAYWYGIVCASFETILQVGVLSFIGFFLSQEDAINPLLYLAGLDGDSSSAGLIPAVSLLCFTVSGAVVGPIYCACCFTLYLNRRARLEAWDIEIMLRQIKAPLRRSGTMVSSVLSGLAFVLAASFFYPAVPVEAASSKEALSHCKRPQWSEQRLTLHSKAFDAEQAKLRAELARLYAGDELRVYDCVQNWVAKNKPTKEAEAEKKSTDVPSFAGAALVAQILKILVIGLAIVAVVWLLYRYRDLLPDLKRSRRPVAATEVGGLDIRPESLPDDVVKTALSLWQDGKQRAALALLYRATLIRIVQEHGLQLNRGATEGDCLHLARQALPASRFSIVQTTTTLWLNAAWGRRWPDSAHFEACCHAWRVQFPETRP